jgi:hypothetical protein
MRDSLLSEWAVPTLMISGAYFLAFATTFAVVMPVQDAVLPAFGNYASLLFLPHGVRVIAAWMYGWRSLLFLAPGAVLTHSYLVSIRPGPRSGDFRGWGGFPIPREEFLEA